MARHEGLTGTIDRPMSTIHFVINTAIAAIFSLATAGGASAEMLKPFKDELFSRQTILESHDDGAFETIDYQEMRDINGRDQIPERRVKQAYVSLGVRRQQDEESLTLGNRRLDVTRTGP